MYKLSSSSSWLVIGGSGLVGSFLVNRLVNDGHRVSVLARAPERVNAKAHQIVADVSREGWLSAIDPTEFDYVIHMAYATTGSAEYCRAVTVKSVVDLIEHFRNSDLLHFILLGSMSVFGMKLPVCKIDEFAPRVSDCEYSRNKIDAVSAVMEANTEFRTSVLHPTGVYSEGSKRLIMYENIFKLGYILGQEKCLGINNIVHADDVANAILGAACRESGGKAQEYIVNGEAVIFSNWLSALETRFGSNCLRLPSILAPLCRGPIRRLLVLAGFRIPIRLPEYKMEIFQRKAFFSSEKALAHFGWSASRRFSDVVLSTEDNLCDY
jgi:nucleoside-diphosphate-sugar epimerase